jgi:small subunit ribosomal protein S20
LAQRHKSAIKRHRQNVKRQTRNQVVRPPVREVIAKKDSATAETMLRATMKTIDKAVTKGALHRNNASRRISRLSSQVAALKSA